MNRDYSSQFINWGDEVLVARILIFEVLVGGIAEILIFLINSQATAVE